MFPNLVGVNCVLTTALAAILCRNRCNANQVIAEFAFFPPNPSYYTPRLDPVSAARARGTPAHFLCSLSLSLSLSCREVGVFVVRLSFSVVRRDEQRVEVNRVDFNYRELDADPHYSRFKRPDGATPRPCENGDGRGPARARVTFVRSCPRRPAGSASGRVAADIARGVGAVLLLSQRQRAPRGALSARQRRRLRLNTQWRLEDST